MAHFDKELHFLQYMFGMRCGSYVFDTYILKCQLTSSKVVQLRSQVDTDFFYLILAIIINSSTWGQASISGVIESSQAIGPFR